MKSNARQDLWVDNLIRIFKQIKLVFFDPLSEVMRGLFTNAIPYYRCCLLGMALGICYRLELDRWLFTRIKLPFLIFEWPVRNAVGVMVTCSAFWVWGVMMVAKKYEIKRKMALIFKSAGIKSKIDLVPEFVSDHPIGKATRKLTVFNNGVPVSEFRQAKEGLEVGLGVQISRMDYGDAKMRTTEIVYVTERLPEIYALDSIHRYKDFSFPIGKGLSNEYTGSLKSFPHYLIAGETGTGKSTFVRMAIEVLLANNELLEVVFLDFKGGIEAESFRENPRVRIVSEFPMAAEIIAEMDAVLSTRNDAISGNGRNIDDFNRKQTDWNKKLKRILIVVDEASELIPKIGGQNHKDLTTIARALSRIARMGRAAGLHLMIGVQKPDQKNLDPTIKANLGGVVCFAVSHPIQSMVVLGDGRAAEINSSIQGRAIWKYGAFSEEVQTPLLNESQVRLAKTKAQEYWGKQRQINSGFEKGKKISPSSEAPQKEEQNEKNDSEKISVAEPPRTPLA